jgi:pyruvate/2-oxoglutarate dehydrogenase complex dihydrolipoamide acyltransferase (E2) component
MLTILRNLSPTSWLVSAAIGLALIAAIALVVRDDLDARHKRQAWNACATAAAGRPAVCPEPIAAPIEAARASAACEAGLRPLVAPSPEAGDWATPASCTPAVRRLAAEHNARRAEVVDRDGQITRLRQDQAGAISRAVSRVRLQERNDANATAALNRAPRDPSDGRVICADDCLRQLAGEGPAPE